MLDDVVDGNYGYIFLLHIIIIIIIINIMKLVVVKCHYRWTVGKATGLGVWCPGADVPMLPFYSLDEVSFHPSITPTATLGGPPTMLHFLPRLRPSTAGRRQG